MKKRKKTKETILKKYLNLGPGYISLIFIGTALIAWPFKDIMGDTIQTIIGTFIFLNICLLVYKFLKDIWDRH